ncbi:MAG: CAP domain-containing protein [Chloroflexota bacterium]
MLHPSPVEAQSFDPPMLGTPITFPATTPVPTTPVPTASITPGEQDPSIFFNGCGGEFVSPTNSEYEQMVVQLTNQERANNGLPPMKWNEELAHAARYHSADMYQDNYFEHDSYDRQDGALVLVCSTWDRIRVYYPSARGENIAWNYRSPESVVRGWINSPGHYANMMAGHREIGVGFFEWYWNQDFGTRRDVYPVIVNGEAIRTDDTEVFIYAYGSWQEMRLRNDDGQWSEWQPFQNQINWTIDALPGLRTVSVEMRNGSDVYANRDTIEYNGSAGTLPTATPTRVQPTPTWTVGPTPTPTLEPTPTPTLESTPTQIIAPTPTPTLTPSLESTPTQIFEPTPTPTSALTTTIPNTPTPTATAVTPAPTEPGSATLRGHVDLEGRPPAPDARWRIELTVSLHDPFSGALIDSYSAVTNDQGNFEIQGITPGIYQIGVKGSHTLQSGSRVDLRNGSAAVNFGLLREGDANNDNVVNIWDFSLWRRHQNQCEGDQAFNPNSDFDQSGCIDLLDVNLLVSHFGLQGSLESNTQRVVDGRGADIQPVVTIRDKHVGDRFSVTLSLSTDSDTAAEVQADSSAVHLRYFPEKLQAISINGHSSFDTILERYIDNQLGHIDFAAAVLAGSALIEGEFATVTFSVVQDIQTDSNGIPQEESIEMVRSGPNASDLALNGESLIAEATTDLMLTIIGVAQDEEALEVVENLYFPLISQ